jgi:tetratricopeptide (TPR) repeat protein
VTVPGKRRILVVTEDALEWAALSQELSEKFELVRANGRDQAVALLDRDGELQALIAYWGALGSGPELMRAAAAKKPKLTRLLISEDPGSGDALGLLDSKVVQAVVADPAGVLLALAPELQAKPPLRAEVRTAVKLEVPVSTAAWEGFKSLWTKDVSRGGAFFLYAHRVVPSSGTACAVKLGAETVSGTVAHVMTARLATVTGGDAGFGVSFAAPPSSDWWTPLMQEAAVAPPRPPAPTGEKKAPSAKERESAKNFFSLAMSLYEANNFSAARQKFELSARCAPDPAADAMQAVCSGQQHARTGQHAMAKEAFERALQLDPACAQATRALGALGRKR